MFTRQFVLIGEKINHVLGMTFFHLYRCKLEATVLN